jgi:hypothetical protein
MTLYNAKSTDDGVRITKFTDDLNVESSYIVSRSSCDCPAGVRDTCRHRQMLPSFVERIDTPWFLDWDNRRWFYYNSETGEFLNPADAPLRRRV